MVDLQAIQQAAARLEGVVRRTPVLHSHRLSERLGCEVYLKLENLQITGAFKLRGAVNCIAQLSAEERRRGVITASAGNHAQGVAAAAQAAGIRATIVMPEPTPVLKVEATASYGAEIILHGADFDQAQEEALRLSRDRGMVFVHPFDDDRVIAGQGTIGLEILDQLPEVDCLLVPVGGGGLISGIATAVRALRPEVTLIGVQAENAPALYLSCQVEELTRAEVVGTLAEGIAVGQPCARTFAIIRRHVERIVTVGERAIARAILELLEHHKLVAEGAGATPVAALETLGEAWRGRTLCLVISGGNVDVTTLSKVIDRGLVEAGRLVKLQVTLPDRPGALAGLAAAIAQAGANIVEVHHDRMKVSLELGQAEVAVVLGTRGPEHIAATITHLHQQGYDVTRLA